MRVLVTGGAGYIGSFVARLLQDQGHEVVVLDNLVYGHNAAVSTTLESGDLLDPAFLDGVFTRHQPDSVMHLAAWIEVGESVTKPAKYFLNNTGGTAALLQAMVNHGVMNLVFSSTAAVYGTPETVPITEDSPTRPENPYGASKLLSEQSFPWYEGAYGLRSISLRYFNAAGGGLDGSMGPAHEPATHLVTNALRAALGRKPFTLFGTDYPTPDGSCIRDYIHVLDIAGAHVVALEYLRRGGSSAAYNVGTGHGFSNLEVIEAARRISGVDFPVAEGPRRAGDPARLVADASRLRQELGWSPQHSELETIMRSAWLWESQHPNGYEELSAPTL